MPTALEIHSVPFYSFIITEDLWTSTKQTPKPKVTLSQIVILKVYKIKTMKDSSYVLLKDFLTTIKPNSNRQPSYTTPVNRPNTKFLIKQIQKNKITIGQSLKEHSLKERSLKSEPFLHASFRNFTINNKPNPAYIKKTYTRNTNEEQGLTIGNEMGKNSHNETMPVIGMEEKKTSKMEEKTKYKHFGLRVGTKAEGSVLNRKKVGGLKINMFFLKKMERCQSETRQYSQNNNQANTARKNDPKSNLLNAQELKLMLKTNRRELRVKYENKVEGRQLRHRSYAEKVAEVLGAECRQIRGDDGVGEKQEVPAGMVLHREANPHRQFILNVRKIGMQNSFNHKYRKQQINSQRKLGNEEPFQFKLRNKTVHRDAPGERFGAHKRINTVNTDILKNVKGWQQFDGEPIEPW